MAITIDRLTGIISVPQSDLALLSGTLYSADTNAIRNSIKEIEASEEGIIWDDTHRHNTTVDLFGITYARTIEYLAPASITFTPDAQWSVRLEGSNNNMGDIEATILNQNQVQVIPTNSAGLIDLEILTSSAYQGQCVVSPTRGQAGTTKPIGTFERPSDNMDDALSIAFSEGLPRFLLTEDMTFTSQDFSLGYTFLGSTPNNVITINAAADVTGCNFENLTLNGEMDGLNLIRDCSLQAVTKLSGFVEKVAFQSTVSITGTTFIAESYSQVVGTGYPVFTTGTNNVILRDYHGSLGISGMTGGTISIELYGGILHVDATCTGGAIYCRGAVAAAAVIDPLATVTIVDETMNKAIWEQDATNVVTGSHGEISRNTSFHGVIHVDVNNGSAGTTYPVGTDLSPVDNITDALIIAAAEGIHNLHITEDIIIGATDDVSSFVIEGAHASKSEITVIAGANTTFTQFTGCTLTGALNGEVVIRNCVIDTITGFEGIIHQCAINSGGVQFANGAAKPSHILDSHSGVPGAATPEFDFNGINLALGIRNYNGGIKIVNKTGAADLSIDMNSGQIILDGTVTAGNIICRGVGKLTDTSGGTAIVDATHLVQAQLLLQFAKWIGLK